MTSREENIVRYMSGYVVAKLKKQFTDLFKSFQIGVQMDPDIVEDFNDYTRIWKEQVA